MKSIVILVTLIAVQATSVVWAHSTQDQACNKTVEATTVLVQSTEEQSSKKSVTVVQSSKTCGTIPYISDLSKACLTRTKDFSGLLVKVVTSLQTVQTIEVVTDVKVLVANINVYVNALIVQVLAGVDLILAAVEKNVITVDLHASINKCHKAISVVIGFAGCSDVSISVWISALIDVGNVIKGLVCDVDSVVKVLSVKLTALLTEVICVLVVLVHAVVFAVNLVIVQLTAFLNFTVTAVVTLLTGTLTKASTRCGGLVVKTTSCVSTNIDPVTFILAELAALTIVLIAGVKVLVNSILGLLGGLFLSDLDGPLQIIAAV